MTDERREIKALVSRLRQGRLIMPSISLYVEGIGYVPTGETREMAHTDALQAADVIERLLASSPNPPEVVQDAG